MSVSLRGSRSRRVTAALVAAALLASLAVSVPSDAASADSRGDLVYFGDGEAQTTAGANGVIRAHGAIRSIPFCLPGGTNDFAFPAADLYVVATGSARPFADLTQADGTKPATIIGFGSTGAFLEEILAVTGPQGALGEGVYDVVVNNCQDGVYHPTFDSVFPRAITVKYPAQLPPYRDSIGNLKRQAAESAALWVSTSILMRALHGAYELRDPKSLTDAIVTSPGWFLDLINDLVAATKKLRPASGGPTQALQGAVNLAAAEATRYLAIAEDPPDHDYAQPTVIDPIETVPATSAFGPKAALEEIAAPAATEVALSKAFLHALERYQGATYASDAEWTLIHARELRQLSEALAVAAETSGDAVAEVHDSIDELTRWDESIQDMVVEAGRIRTTGFTPEERRTLLNLGLTAEELNTVHASMSDSRPYETGLARTRDALRENTARLQQGQQDMAEELRAYAERLDDVIADLEAQGSVPKSAPEADAGTAYAGVVGTPLALDGSASRPGEGGAITSYEWDTDGDGAFDDAAGATASFTPAVGSPGVVGLKVTGADGAASVAYAAVTLDRGSRPVIANEGPTFATAKVGEPFTLSVPIDGGTAQWRLDGVPVGDGPVWSFTPTSDDLGVFHLDLVVTAPNGGQTIENWYLAVVDVDEDGDGWSITADCDDADALVHPGRTELPGNGLDDDCNPGTSDTPFDGLTGAVSSWGELPEADAVALGRAAGNAELSRTAADVRGLDGVRRVAAGHRTGFALSETGALWAWGYGADGQLGRGSAANAPTPVPVAGLSGTGQLGADGPAVTDVAANRIGIARLADGTAAAWGPNPAGALGTGSTAASGAVPAPVRGPDGPLGEVTAVTSAGTFAAVVAGGSVYVTRGMCGTDASATASAVEGLPGPATELAAGSGHLLILLDDGRVFGCGANDRGQLGDGPPEVAAPVEIDLGEEAARTTRLAAGDGFSLALDVDGELRSWGTNEAGQLGRGDTGAYDPDPASVDLPEGPSVTALTAGGERAAVLRADGTLITWGHGNPAPAQRAAVEGAAISDVALGASGEITYAVMSRERPVVAWGTAVNSVAGPGIAGDFAPTVAPLPSFRQLMQNGVAAAGLSADGAVWSWGSAAHLGNGYAGPGGVTRREPGPVLGVGGTEGSQLRARQLASGIGDYSKFGAILDGGQVAIWGSAGGHSGDGDAPGYRPHPTLMLAPDGTGPLTGATQLALGAHQSLVLRDDGTALGFGASPDPCKGPGSGNSGYLPVLVESAGDDLRQVAVVSHTGTAFFLTRDGELLSCGAAGSIGRTPPPNTLPWVIGQVEGMGPGSVVQVAAGLQGALALKSDGTVWGWGQDNLCSLGCTDGQSGSGTARRLPEQIHLPEGPRVVALAHSTVTSFAIREDGSVLGWGWNLNGQIGLPSEVRSVETPTVVPVPGDRPVASIVASTSADISRSLVLAQVGDPLERLPEVRGPGIDASAADATAVEGETARVIVTLSHAARVDVELAYETEDGSAVAGVDYESTSGRLVIPAGETSAVIDVPTIDNETTQTGVDRRFSVRVSEPPAWAGLADDLAVVSISDDDPEPVVSIVGPGETEELHSGSRDVTFEVSLDRPSQTAMSVAWRTNDGTAQSTADYLGAEGVLSFQPGQTTATIPVGVNGDAVLEPDETFSVELYDPQGLTVSGAAGSAEFTIVDDEPVLVTVTDGEIPAPSATTVMPFTISAAGLLPGERVTVPWSVSAPWQGGDPRPEAVSGSGQVELTAEHPSEVVDVIVEPAEREAPQRFLVELIGASSASGRDVVAVRGTGTIADGDVPPDPVAVIDGPMEIDEGTTAGYRASASTGAGELAFAWDLDADGEYDDAHTAEVEVPFAAFGSRAISLRATDQHGVSDTASLTVTVRNVAPAVEPLADVEVRVGETIRVEGGFADPGANSWSASVDYGHGVEPLDLDGAQFLLERTFTESGVFGATVRVCDDGGACGEQRFTVTVVASAPAITGIAPDRGPVSGGTRVVISGSSLFAPSGPVGRPAVVPEIAFGDGRGTDVACERLGAIDACSVTTPAHLAGAVAVTLTAPGGESATVDAGYRYEAVVGPGPKPGDPGRLPDAPPGAAVGGEPDEGGIAATGWQLPGWALAMAALAILLGALLVGRRRSPGRSS